MHRWLALLILVLLSGLRFRLAPDTVAYMAQFRTDVVPIYDLSFNYLANARYEPLWVLLNSAGKTFDSFILVQIAVAWIFNGCVFYFFRKATTKFYTAILLFYLTCYFYFSMEIMRESLAVAMFLIAIVRYNDRRLLSFYFWLIAASLFHKFALLMALAAPFILTRRIPVTLKVVSSVALIGLLASLVNPLEYIASISGFLADLNLQLYEVEGELSPFGLAYNLLRITPIALVLLWYRYHPLPDLRIRNEVVRPLCWTFVFIIIIRIISIPFMDRIANYFVFFVICYLVSAIAELIEKGPLRSFRRTLVGTVSVLSLIFYVLPLLPPDPRLGDIPTYRRYYPYSSVFFMQTDPDREYLISIEAKE